MARRAGLTILAGAAVLLGSQTARATDSGPTQTGDANTNICMQAVFGAPVSGSNKLNCTANDIRLSRAISVSQGSCTEGETFDLTATFETIVTANARYDAGFFFRIDGGDSARGDGKDADGICSLSALTPFPPPPSETSALELDGDTCGDLNAGTYNLTFTIPGVLCQDSDGDGFLNLPNCTSWHSNQATTCDISDPPVPADAFDFHPDTRSKCVCDDTFQVPITVARPELTARPTQATVRYEVKVKNKSATKDLLLAALCDTLYGTIVGDATLCGSGTITQPAKNFNTCVANTVIPKNSEYTCLFDVPFAPPGLDTPVLDTVTARLSAQGAQLEQSALLDQSPSDDTSVTIKLPQ